MKYNLHKILNLLKANHCIFLKNLFFEKQDKNIFSQSQNFVLAHKTTIF